MKAPRPLTCLGLGLVMMSCVYAFSLYDTAPSLGLEKSENLRYDAYIIAGLDDNVNATSTDKESALFMRVGLGASQSSRDALSQITWTFKLGSTLFNSDADNTNDSLFADCAAYVKMVTRIDTRSTNMLTARLSLSPDLDYSNGISGANRVGESFNWWLSDVYSYALDTRQVISLRGSYSGNIYRESIYSDDDRQYLSAGVTYTYKYSNLTSFNSSLSTQYDFRSKGYNSYNIYWMLGMQSTLSPHSSVGLNVGAQLKSVNDEYRLYPNMSAAYNYRLREDTLGAFYIALTNENIETYVPLLTDDEQIIYANYLSDMTWRVGGNLTHQLTPRFSVMGGVSMMYCQYSDSTSPYLADRDEATYMLSAGCRYQMTPSLGSSLRYTYTFANKDAGDYQRNTFAAGLDYNF